MSIQFVNSNVQNLDYEPETGGDAGGSDWVGHTDRLATPSKFMSSSQEKLWSDGGSTADHELGGGGSLYIARHVLNAMHSKWR